MNFTVLVPARLQSTRLPRKILADLGGVPMVVRVAQRAAQSSAHRVVVAADNGEIVRACDAHGIASVLTRTNHPTGSDRLAEACELLSRWGITTIVAKDGAEAVTAALPPESAVDGRRRFSWRPPCVLTVCTTSPPSRKAAGRTGS